MKNIKLYLVCLAIIITDSAYPNNQNSTKPDKWITVFAHGSFSLRPHLNISNILKMLNDSIEESIYYRSTEINRRDPFFYKNQAMSDLGLHKIDIHNLTNTSAAPIIGYIFEQVSELSNYPKSEEYYTFGWSGLVSNKLRYLEGDLLHRSLLKIVNKVREQGYNPKIRLIGYSHGGNLALQLGAIHQTKSKDKQISIDELYLLGTPVQIETDYLINSPIFKKIYNFYSKADKVQTLDFFSFKRFFSKRKFTKRKNFKLPDKLIQIQLKITDYELRNQKKSPPQNLSEKKMHRYYKKINYDPGHFELWFMGWTILTYREKFPTNPLPILVFLPLIVKYISDHPSLSHDIIAHIKPLSNTIKLYPYRIKHNLYETEESFFDHEKLKYLQTYARNYAPDNYNIETYNRKVYDAINIAADELKKINSITKVDRKNKRKHKKPKNKK